MRVSIVTSVLNGVKTLPQCLASVASQTYPCEHVVVDGGSTDGTQEIVRHSGYPNTFLIPAPGTDISEAFNIGIQCSTGEIIAILNADDWYERDAVERSVMALDQEPTVGFTYASVLVHMDRYLLVAHPKITSGDLMSEATRQMMFYHITSFVRRSVYEQHGMFDSRYKATMDFDFYARIITRGVKGVYVPGILGHALWGGTTSNLWRRSKDTWKISSQYLGPVRAFFSVMRRAMNSAAFSIAMRNRLLRHALNTRKGVRIVVMDIQHGS